MSRLNCYLVESRLNCSLCLTGVNQQASLLWSFVLHHVILFSHLIELVPVAIEMFRVVSNPFFAYPTVRLDTCSLVEIL